MLTLKLEETTQLEEKDTKSRQKSQRQFHFSTHKKTELYNHNTDNLAVTHAGSGVAALLSVSSHKPCLVDSSGPAHSVSSNPLVSTVPPPPLLSSEGKDLMETSNMG